MVHVRIFISAVSREFAGYRDLLRSYLARPNVTVHIQEDFIAGGLPTLDKLDRYINKCDAVIHLVGDMTGATARPASLEHIIDYYPDLTEKLPDLKPAFEGVLDISYTQWEAYLAIYHKKELLVAVPVATAPREASTYIKSADQMTAQQAHLERLRRYERFPVTFKDGENLALQLFNSTLYDLLIGAGVQAREKGVDPKDLIPILENLGHRDPNISPADFLMAKVEEFRKMRERLKTLAETEGRISELLNAANAALGEGDFGTADDLLKEAEAVQLQSSTIVALKKQAQLRIERGNAALVNGDVAAAAAHFERSSRYFSGVDAALEADNRHDCATLLRYYAYRHKSHEALYAARSALQQNLSTWQKEIDTEKWCQTKNALGGVSVRLSQFDVPENAMSHLADAKGHYEDVRALCSEDFLPKIFATASVDLANVYSARRLAKTDEEYEKNLQLALSLELSALCFISKSKDSRSWGILQHNLGCSYIRLSNARTDEAKSAVDIENAIRHLELSFEVRNPEDSLQYWVASCRSLGEALLNMSTYSIAKDATEYVRRASQVLHGAAARISVSEHPHQWAEIQEQLARCGERSPA